MADKLMYIPNDNTQNYSFSKLKLVVEKFGQPTQFVKATNKKTLF